MMMIDNEKEQKQGMDQNALDKEWNTSKRKLWKSTAYSLQVVGWLPHLGTPYSVLSFVAPLCYSVC